MLTNLAADGMEGKDFVLSGTYSMNILGVEGKLQSVWC